MRARRIRAFTHHRGVALMPHRAPVDLMGLAMDSWFLGVESAMVIGIRTMQMMTMAPGHRREVIRMVTEKMEANATLPFMLALAAPQSPTGTARAAIRHYGRKVSANRRRLTRK